MDGDELGNCVSGRIRPEDKERLKFLFIAKHALSDGAPDAQDGDHAVYHCHVRDTLRQIGLNIDVANSPQDMFTRPNVDFVFSLLNRAGFLNSEMLIPLLCEMHNHLILAPRRSCADLPMTRI